MRAPKPIAGVILAGGRSSRMGGRAKHGVVIGGITLLERVIARFAPQVDALVVNLNDVQQISPNTGLTIVRDSLEDYPGPLAGLVAAFEYLEAAGAEFGAVAMVPCDGPLVPENLVAVLAHAFEESDASVACVRYRGEMQPTFSLWRRSAGSAVIRRLKECHEGGFKGLFAELPTVFVDWPEYPVDPFFNINTPEDVARAEKMLD